VVVRETRSPKRKEPATRSAKRATHLGKEPGADGCLANGRQLEVPRHSVERIRIALAEVRCHDLGVLSEVESEGRALPTSEVLHDSERSPAKQVLRRTADAEGVGRRERDLRLLRGGVDRFGEDRARESDELGRGGLLVGLALFRVRDVREEVVVVGGAGVDAEVVRDGGVGVALVAELLAPVDELTARVDDLRTG
jgi:hypothetical protein